MFNHSDDPNAVVGISTGIKTPAIDQGEEFNIDGPIEPGVFVDATRDIETGEQVFVKYGDLEQESLHWKLRYGFSAK